MNKSLIPHQRNIYLDNQNTTTVNSGNAMKKVERTQHCAIVQDSAGNKSSLRSFGEAEIWANEVSRICCVKRCGLTLFNIILTSVLLER